MQPTVNKQAVVLGRLVALGLGYLNSVSSDMTSYCVDLPHLIELLKTLAVLVTAIL